MVNPEKIEIEGLKTIHRLCKFGADHNMEGCSFTEIVGRMFSKIEEMTAQVNTLDEMLLNQGEALVKAKAQAVPEGFVLVPTKNVKFFSHDGENYEVHDTLSGAKHEAKCAIQHYEDMLADQTTDPRSDGNFSQVGYGIVLAESGYSIDHVVTQKDVDKGDYSYEVGTEIMSLFLVEAQEQSHD